METGGPVRAFAESGEELRMAFDHEDILGMAVKRIRFDWGQRVEIGVAGTRLMLVAV